METNAAESALVAYWGACGLLLGDGVSDHAGILSVFAGVSFLSVMGIIILILSTQIQAAKKRTSMLQQVAQQLGIPFSPNQGAFLRRLHRFPAFSPKRQMSIRNMLHGERQDVEFAIFDSRMSFQSGNSVLRRPKRDVFSRRDARSAEVLRDAESRYSQDPQAIRQQHRGHRPGNAPTALQAVCLGERRRNGRSRVVR